MKSINKRLIVWGLVIIGLLSIPLIAMQFSDEVNWKPSDFVIMGAALSVLALSYEFIALKAKTAVYRWALGLALLGAFLLFWVNGAVGIIGNEGQDANLLYLATFAVGITGSLMVKFKAKGMARTLFAVTVVQLLVPVIALLIWPPSEISWSPGIFGVFVLSSFFALLFLISGLLFKRAAREIQI